MSSPGISSVPPSTEVLRNRPAALEIGNPIDIGMPILPAPIGLGPGFNAAEMPLTLQPIVELFKTDLQTSSELGLVQEVNNSANKGLYFRSSSNQVAAARAAAGAASATASGVKITRKFQVLT